MKTMIEWHKGKPTKSGIYLVVMNFCEYYVVGFSAKYNKWNAYDSSDNDDYAFADDDVLAWADGEKDKSRLIEWAKDDNTGN